MVFSCSPRSLHHPYKPKRVLHFFGVCQSRRLTRAALHLSAPDHLPVRKFSSSIAVRFHPAPVTSHKPTYENLTFVNECIDDFVLNGAAECGLATAKYGMDSYIWGA